MRGLGVAQFPSCANVGAASGYSSDNLSCETLSLFSSYFWILAVLKASLFSTLPFLCQ